MGTTYSKVPCDIREGKVVKLPRINTTAYDRYRPGRIVVCKAAFRLDRRPWRVYRGGKLVGFYETHSEAMSEAVKLANAWTGDPPGELVQLRARLLFEPLVG